MQSLFLKFNNIGMYILAHLPLVFEVRFYARILEDFV
jgi:hypothetical protein